MGSSTLTQGKHSDHPAGDTFYSTREAAKILGVSLSLVQTMVETGQLKAWKTIGGHRRILIESVRDFINKRNSEVGRTASTSGVSILICDDDPAFVTLLEKTIGSWDMEVAITKVTDGYSALLSIGRQVPDLLILDLMMAGIDGFKVLQTIRTDPNCRRMNIIVITGMSKAKIAERGDLPSDVTVFRKPVSFPELKGYLQALQAKKQQLNDNTPAAPHPL